MKQHENQTRDNDDDDDEANANDGRTGQSRSRTVSEHAEWFVPTLRNWSNATFMQALSTHRPESNKQAIVRAFWEKYERLVAPDPAQHGMDYFHTFLVVRKK